MNRHVLRFIFALGLLPAVGCMASAPTVPTLPPTPPPPPRAIAVTLSDSLGTPGEDVPCLAAVSASDKVLLNVKPDTTITWTFNGGGCTGGYNASKLRVRFGKNSKLFVDKSALTKCIPQSATVCAITATIVDKTKVKDKSKHPYGFTLDGDDLGDPEIDMDNGGGAPPPPVPPTGG